MNQVVPVTQPDPTVEGFTNWIYMVMGVPQTALPVGSPYIQLAFDESVNVAYYGLQLVPNRAAVINPPYRDPRIYPDGTPPKPAWQSPSIYAIAVYNLGGHILVGIAADDPNADPPSAPPTFWSDLRTKLELNTFTLGFVTSASDQGTSAGQQIPSMISDMSLLNMDMLKTPWGRRYLQIAGQWGTIWGIS